MERRSTLDRMSVKRLSPTADLLRNSRLFALPNPLPRPNKPPLPFNFGNNSNLESDTATQRYPTHAAIETTEEGLGRGDWGLKRALPLRSTTRTSTPTVRIGNVDSIDHITDFASAADHVLTLRKWQELDMPLSVMVRERRASQRVPPPQSVFESDIDNTAIHPDSVEERWKFAGPWLTGQDEFEFEDYLKRTVKKQKAAFREFLRLRMAKSQVAAKRREAVENGNDVTETPENINEEASKITDGAVDFLMKQLGQNQDAMQRTLEEFLDLPRRHGASRSMAGQPSYNDKGPPRTHPSAGLSYLRTASHRFNHPIHGPQEDKTPTLSRVLKPQAVLALTGRQTNKRNAIVGVAGVTAEDPAKPFATGDHLPDIEVLQPDKKGGGKVWTQPTRAEIDVQGAIQLTYKRAEMNAINVLLKDRGEYRDDGLPAAAVKSATDRSVPDLAPSKPAGAKTSSGYGLENLTPATSPRAKPFPPESNMAILLEQALQKNAA